MERNCSSVLGQCSGPHGVEGAVFSNNASLYVYIDMGTQRHRVALARAPRSIPPSPRFPSPPHRSTLTLK